MRLSTKSRYAVIAMSKIALQRSERPVTLAYLSDNLNISLSYLEQLFARLREKGLVRGVRGPGGGYYLARDIDEISVGEIICAVDHQVKLTQLTALQSSYEAKRCMSHDLWDGLSQRISDFLYGVSLGELVRRVEEREEDNTMSSLVNMAEQAA